MANDNDKIAVKLDDDDTNAVKTGVDKDVETLARERYLALWLHVSTHKPEAEFDLYGGTKVKGRLVGTDSESNRFRVNNLETPMGVYKQGVLRSFDVEQIRLV